MLFGDFDEANCFHIEKLDLYNRDLSSHGIKSVEFVLYRPEKNKLLFVEAKTSLPIKERQGWLNSEITKISQKFMDSLQLVCGIWLRGDNGKTKLPDNYANFFEKGVEIVFILVIKRRGVNLLHIADAIKANLLKEHKLWNFSILVLNEELARNKDLIVKNEL